MKVITISLLTAVREIGLFLIFFFLGVAQDKMEAVEVYNKVQRYREKKHQTENEMRSYLDFYKVRSEELKKEADDLQSFLCAGKYSN